MERLTKLISKNLSGQPPELLAGLLFPFHRGDKRLR
jgi:hypothetical protein